MFPYFRPLQELPCLNENLDGSLLCMSQSKAKKRPCVYGDGLHAENTPNELIQHWSPPRKQPRPCTKGKENTFVLARRPRRSRDTAGQFHYSTYCGRFSFFWHLVLKENSHWNILGVIQKDLRLYIYLFSLFLWDGTIPLHCYQQAVECHCG